MVYEFIEEVFYAHDPGAYIDYAIEPEKTRKKLCKTLEEAANELTRWYALAQSCGYGQRVFLAERNENCAMVICEKTLGYKTYIKNIAHIEPRYSS